jgi:hypothetical protein
LDSTNVQRDLTGPQNLKIWGSKVQGKIEKMTKIRPPPTYIYIERKDLLSTNKIEGKKRKNLIIGGRDLQKELFFAIQAGNNAKVTKYHFIHPLPSTPLVLVAG